MVKFLQDVGYRQRLRWWKRQAAKAKTMSLPDLRKLRTNTQRFTACANRINQTAFERLTLPVLGSKAIYRPQGTEWAFRPLAWSAPTHPNGMSSVPAKTKIGDGLTLFHDCPAMEMTWRQIRNRAQEDMAPFSIRLDVFKFAGSYLSFAIETPEESVKNLRKEHIFRMSFRVDSERPQEVFARLNLQHGPNIEQIVRELDVSTQEFYVEFDLFYTKFNEHRVEKIWFDLIFQNPSLNQITIRDVAIIRRLRANT